jgi:hypothetical protein
MNNKTCGECKHFDSVGQCKSVRVFNSIHDWTLACIKFEAKKPTNGDVIRQGGNRELAEIFDDFYNGNKCKYCINYISGNCKFDDKHAEYDEGGWVEDKDCIDGIESWLNDAIHNVIKNGVKIAIDIHETAYAPDINDGTTESEVKDE